LTGGPSATAIDGGDGDDDLRGGPGNDTISAATIPDTGLASGFLFENGKDKVSCGDGNDQVFADRHDTVASDCEVVGRPWRLTSSGDNYLYTGSRQSDTIVVRQFVNAIVKAGAGDDLVRLENDSFGVLYGQAGDDNLRGGTSGDRFSGGPGNDTITSYTRADDRDFVTCGPGHDRVIADRKDRVARDCEKVSRRR
ncbi:MAG: hypothetical protein QOJ07_233, partial [Thermoleophilaceae bacterium]|nr:hypothetical protein [Thermoleophilaceae bacterium]